MLASFKMRRTQNCKRKMPIKMLKGRNYQKKKTKHEMGIARKRKRSLFGFFRNTMVRGRETFSCGWGSTSTWLVKCFGKLGSLRTSCWASCFSNTDWCIYLCTWNFKYNTICAVCRFRESYHGTVLRINLIEIKAHKVGEKYNSPDKHVPQNVPFN